MPAQTWVQHIQPLFSDSGHSRAAGSQRLQSSLQRLPPRPRSAMLSRGTGWLPGSAIPEGKGHPSALLLRGLTSHQEAHPCPGREAAAWMREESSWDTEEKAGPSASPGAPVRSPLVLAWWKPGPSPTHPLGSLVPGTWRLLLQDHRVQEAPSWQG